MDNDYKPIPPFNRFVLQNFPFIEDDFDALNTYQLLCKIVDYLNKVINAQNELGESQEALIAAFNQLKDYVDHYFDNLNVQEEINNKLDDMAESGQLEEIIAQYLELDAIMTFDTVADLKSATNLVDGSFVKTLGYSAINDDGGALYKISETEPSTYYEVLNSGLYAYIITDTANVKKFGATGDGVTDDAPAIRKAIAYLKSTLKSVLYFPKGTYYINSGDPRGMSTEGTFVNADFYTCFEVINNMKIYGEGEGTVLLYNSNRLGKNTVTNRGDVGAIFANFRVNGTDNYAVYGTVEIKNINVEYTSLTEQNIRDYIDGQLIRVNTDNVSMSNEWHQNVHGNFIFENIGIKNATGHQVFNVTGAKNVNATNVRFHNYGKMLNNKNSDFSGFFINATVCEIDKCTSICDSASTGTFIELHCTNGYITNCFAENNSTFTNLVGNVSGYASRYEVSNNIVKGIINFSNEYVYSYRYTDNIYFHDNDVTLRYDSNTTTEHLMLITTEGGIQGTENAIESIIFNNNICKTAITDSEETSTQTNYNYPIRLDLIKDIIIRNNQFGDFRRGMFYITDGVTYGNIRKIIIEDNKFEGIGVLSASSFDMSAFMLNLPAGYGLNDINKLISIKNNYLNIKKTSGSSKGIYLNYRGATTDTKTKVFIEGNIIDGSTQEINLYAKNATGTFSRGILLKHHYRNAVTNTINTILGNNADSVNIADDSEVDGTINSYYFKVTCVSNDKYKQIVYVNNESPSDMGYFRKGSVAYNMNPSFTNESPYAWVCSVAGSSGTWIPFNPAS